MTRPAHTALPGTIVAQTIAGDVPRQILQDDDYPERAADADFIVRAVNCHDELVNALETILAKHKGLFGDPPHELAGCDMQDIERAYAILARAKEPRP